MIIKIDEEVICDCVLDGIDSDYTYNYDCYQISSDFTYLVGVQSVACSPKTVPIKVRV